MKTSDPKVLVYDIETTPVLAWIWRCGEQYVRHPQLHEDYNQTKIICITYRWMHQKKAKALVYDIKKQCDKKILVEFSKLVGKADVVLGKNSARFDDKHINFRLFQNKLDPIPDWSKKCDDLERWMRRTFNMQSFALDYFAKLTTGAGKNDMCMQDWIDIVLHKDRKKLKKMVDYGLKDADDTAELIERVQPYVKPKYNMAQHYGDIRCTNCGSKNIHKNGIRAGRQNYYCKEHGGHAGSALIRKDGNYGKMGK